MLTPSLLTINQMILNRDLEFLSLFGNRAGEDAPYLLWLREQECKACGAVPHWEMDDFIYNIACHVRRVSKGSGTGIKPPWNANSMCQGCHDRQHGAGESFVATSEMFDQWADESLALYVMTSLRENLGSLWIEILPDWLQCNMVDSYDDE